MSLKEVWFAFLLFFPSCFLYGDLIVSIQRLDLDPLVDTTSALRSALSRIPDGHNPSLLSVADTVNRLNSEEKRFLLPCGSSQGPRPFVGIAFLLRVLRRQKGSQDEGTSAPQNLLNWLSLEILSEDDALPINLLTH